MHPRKFSRDGIFVSTASKSFLRFSKIPWEPSVKSAANGFWPAPPIFSTIICITSCICICIICITPCALCICICICTYGGKSMVLQSTRPNSPPLSHLTPCTLPLSPPPKTFWERKGRLALSLVPAKWVAVETKWATLGICRLRFRITRFSDQLCHQYILIITVIMSLTTWPAIRRCNLRGHSKMLK